MLMMNNVSNSFKNSLSTPTATPTIPCNQVSFATKAEFILELQVISGRRYSTPFILHYLEDTLALK
jgi:hypothetical protein